MEGNPPKPSFGPDWQRGVALAVLTAIGVYLCYQIALPFLPGLTWAVALAVVGFPLHQRIARIIRNRTCAAGLSTTLVVLGIAVPVALVAIQLANETTRASVIVKEKASNGDWLTQIQKVPYVGEWIAQNGPEQLESKVRSEASQLASRSMGFLQGIIGVALQALVAIFVLFFCFRDQNHLLGEVRKLLPLSPANSTRVLGRAEDAVHATVYGTLLTSAIQGVTGGLLFWALGLPAPVLWGVIMFVLGALPFVGAFLIWVPAALYLASLDRWLAAGALVAWGLAMAGPVCNFIYAHVAGDRMRMHPVPTLIAFIGGLAVFGISGMVLGPCILVVTVALLDIWRYRLAGELPASESASNENPSPG